MFSRKGVWLALAALMLCAAPASANHVAGEYVISLGPPLDSFNIQFKITNNDTFDLLMAVFDLSMTQSLAGPNLIIEPPIFGEIPPPGGTLTYGGNSPDFTQFKVNFTSFNTGEMAFFNIDPDIEGDSGYGAIIAELAGTKITLFTAGGVTATGVLVLNEAGDGLVAHIASVPEPTTLLLAGLVGSILGGGFVLRRRQAAA